MTIRVLRSGPAGLANSTGAGCGPWVIRVGWTMKRRSSRWAWLGLGVLGLAAGCHNFKSSKPDPEIKAPPRMSPADLAAAREAAMDDKDRPRRKPKASTCVAFGDFRVSDVRTAPRSDAERKHLLDQAREAYKEALEIDPKCAAAHRGLAQVALLERDEEQALVSLRAALELAPREAALWYELGMIHSRRKEWDPALDALNRAAEIDPANKKYAMTMGHCLARAGAYDQAYHCFRSVVGEARAHYNVARMMHHMKQPELSRQQVQLALQKEPDLVQAKQLLAQLDAGALPTQGSVLPAGFEDEQPE